MVEEQSNHPHEIPDGEEALRPLLNEQQAKSLLDLAKAAARCPGASVKPWDFDDVVSETILKALKHLTKVRETSCTLALLCCIARHAVADLKRPHKNGVISTEEAQRFDPDTLYRLSDHSVFQDQRDELEENAALRKLVLTSLYKAFAPEMRSALYWHGSGERRTRKHTALALGISERTVDKHMSRLRTHAQKALSHQRRQLFGPHGTRRHARNRRRPIK